MSQLKVNTIRHTGASSDAITLASDGTATAKITNRSNRNIIINGAMQVAQRGTSSTSLGFICDRFYTKWDGADEAITHAQVAVTADTPAWNAGFRKALQLTNGNQTSGAGAADYVYIQSYLEAQDLANSGWDYTSTSSYVTLSFWVKSSVAQNFYGRLWSIDGTSQAYVFETGSLSADTWTKVTKTIPGAANVQFDDNTDAGFQFLIAPFYGTDKTGTRPLNAWAASAAATTTPDYTSTWYTTNDATFAITGVQLEVGDTATDFEHRSYGDELQRCLRYYWHASKIGSTSDVSNKGIGFGFYHQTGEARFHFQYPVIMRAQPTVISNNNSNSWYFNPDGTADLFDDFAVYSTTNQNAILKNDSDMNGTSGRAGVVYQETGDSSLGFDAEL